MKAGSRSTACLALVRAFCPGEGSTLRECRERDWNSATFTGVKIEIEFDLPDEAARKRAFDLNEFAKDAGAADIPVRGWMFSDITVQVRGDRLRILASAVRD